MLKKDKIWTTLSAIVGFILMALMVFGIISADEKSALNQAWQTIVAAIPGGDWTVILGAGLVFVQQIIMIIVKDPKTKTPK